MNASILRCLGAFAVVVATSPRSVAAAPAGHYVVSAGSEAGNGTVYDSKSKLTWQQTVSSARFSWSEAQTYCAGVGASLGGTGWRVPTFKELLSIVDFSQTGGPMVDPNAFPSTPSDEFWSSSPAAGSSSYAWGVDFKNGHTYYAVLSEMSYVRCVR